MSYWQVIALNSSKAAEGELYVDDGNSFNFQQGAYIHRHFVFSDGKLISINMASASRGNMKFASDAVIERIILLGHASVSKKKKKMHSLNYRITRLTLNLPLFGFKGHVAQLS